MLSKLQIYRKSLAGCGGVVMYFILSKWDFYFTKEHMPNVYKLFEDIEIEKYDVLFWVNDYDDLLFELNDYVCCEIHDTISDLGRIMESIQDHLIYETNDEYKAEKLKNVIKTSTRYNDFDSIITQAFESPDAKDYTVGELEEVCLYECSDKKCDNFMLYLKLIAYEAKHNILTKEMKEKFFDLKKQWDRKRFHHELLPPDIAIIQKDMDYLNAILLKTGVQLF